MIPLRRLSALALFFAITLADEVSTPGNTGPRGCYTTTVNPPTICSTFTTRYTTVTEHYPTVTVTSPITETDTTTTIETTSLLDSCTFTGTQTFYSSSGCDLACSTGFCIIDAAVTRSCGCPRVEIKTVTTTVCPTRTPCYQCYTGWGTFFYNEPCTTSVPVPTGY